MVITKSAEKDLRKLSAAVQERILLKLNFYASSGNPLAFAEKLHDHPFGGYRFRIGDYRVLFDVSDSEIYILAVGHRRNIYS